MAKTLTPAIVIVAHHEDASNQLIDVANKALL